MGNYRRFTGGGGGGQRYIKWDQIGTSISGYAKKFVDEPYRGKSNLNCIMDVDGDEKQFSVPTQLRGCLSEAFGSIDAVPNDVRLTIVYVELVEPEKGSDWKRFTLDVNEAEYDLWCKATGFNPDKDGESA